MEATLHSPSQLVSSSSRSTPKSVIAGRIISGIGMLFLAMDLSFKFFVTPEAVASSEQLGWAANSVLGLGLLELSLLVLYALPRTSAFGALLWTGYLGGAIATHLRVGNPLFSHVLFPVYVAAFLWVGLWLRNPRSRGVLPFGG